MQILAAASQFYKNWSSARQCQEATIEAWTKSDSRRRLHSYVPQYRLYRKGPTSARARGDVRGEGMLCALEFVKQKDGRVFFDAADKVGPQVAAALAKEGVIGRAMPQGDILGFAPPLCLDRAEADKIVDAARKAVVSVLG